MTIVCAIVPRFALGSLVATANAVAAFPSNTLQECLARHAAGDWGDLCDEDLEANDDALACGGRIMSSYKLAAGRKLWVITEGDRSATTLLLPEDY